MTSWARTVPEKRSGALASTARWRSRAAGSEDALHARAIELGLAGDVWVAGNQRLRRFELATARSLDHEVSSSSFAVAPHRPTRRAAFAGYGGTVTAGPTDRTH